MKYGENLFTRRDPRALAPANPAATPAPVATTPAAAASLPRPAPAGDSP